MLSILPSAVWEGYILYSKKKRGSGGLWASIENNTADPRPPVKAILITLWYPGQLRFGNWEVQALPQTACVRASRI